MLPRLPQALPWAPLSPSSFTMARLALKINQTNMSRLIPLQCMQRCQPQEIFNLESLYVALPTSPCQQPHHSPPTNWPLFMTKYVQECSKNHIMNKKSSNFEEKKWAKFQTEAQKSSKVHFIGEIWWPVWKSGRLVPYPGHSRIIQESWHIRVWSLKGTVQGQ